MGLVSILAECYKFHLAQNADVEMLPPPAKFNIQDFEGSAKSTLSIWGKSIEYEDKTVKQPAMLKACRRTCPEDHECFAAVLNSNYAKSANRPGDLSKDQMWEVMYHAC